MTIFHWYATFHFAISFVMKCILKSSNVNWCMIWKVLSLKEVGTSFQKIDYTLLLLTKRTKIFLFNSFQHYSTFFRGWPAKTKKISLPTKDNKIAISGHFWAIRTIFKKSGVKIRIFFHFCCLFFPHYGKKVFSTLWKKKFFHTMEKKDNFSNSSKWQVNIS